MMRAGAEWVVSLTTLVTMRVTICRGVTPSGGSKPYVLSPQSPKGSTLGRSTSAPQRETMVVRVQGGEPCEERLFLALMSQSGVDPFARREAHQLSGCRSPTRATTHNVLQIDALRTRSNVDRGNENRT